MCVNVQSVKPIPLAQEGSATLHVVCMLNVVIVTEFVGNRLWLD